MKRFLIRMAIFIALPLLLLAAAELILPPSWFAFRAWEVVSIRKSRYFFGPFFPHVELTMTETGDLAHHTKYAVKKQVTWKTDRLGYRNDHYTPNPEIVIIGDSFIAGATLSQEETLGAKLGNYTGRSCYNIAPGDITNFIRMKNAGMLQVPRVIVLSRLERLISTLPAHDPQSKLKYDQLRTNRCLQFFAAQLQKVLRANSLRFIKARANRSIGGGVQSKINEQVFFLEGANAGTRSQESALRDIVNRMKEYKQYCDSIGCEFIFLPMPDKETILWELAGLQTQPVFLEQLHQELLNHGIMTIDTAQLFIELKNNGIMPYHNDDTHWNKFAVDAVAQELARSIDKIDIDHAAASKHSR